MELHEEKYEGMILETVSKLEREENCEFQMPGGDSLWICPMPESTLNESLYWLIVFSGKGMHGVCRWAGQAHIDEFWFIKQGFPMKQSVDIAQLLMDIIFARAKRTNNGGNSTNENNRLLLKESITTR